MFEWLRIKLVKCLLKSKFSLKNKLILTNIILENLDALPLYDIIKVNEEGTLLINNRPVDFETASKLRDSAKGLMNNYARKVIREQVKFAAITHGIHHAELPEQMLFAKSALWWGDQEEEVIKILSGERNSSLNEI